MNKSLKELFLARTARWEWHDNVTIDILDDQDQPIYHLGEWQTLVFHEADGNHTMEMIVADFPSNYKDKSTLPAEYDRHIANATKSLVEGLKVVDLWTKKDDLPHKHVWAVSEQIEGES